MPRRHWGVLVGLLVAMLGVACQEPAERSADPNQPRRIICLVPSLTETVFSIGCGDQVVAVSDFVIRPVTAAALPRVGGLVNPNIERILALRPDLVLIPSPIDRVERACARAGVQVERVPMENIEGVKQGILTVAELLGRPDHGRRLVAEIEAELERVGLWASRGPRPRILAVLDRPPTGRLQQLTVVGPDTFLDQLINLAGGVNLFADAGRPYFTPALEEVLRRRPDLILELRPGAPSRDLAERQVRIEWQALFGDQTPALAVVTDPGVLIPGPGLIRTARTLVEIIHPETS